MSVSHDPAPITLERLAQVLRPIGAATGLPNVAYTGEAYFRHERDAVIGRTWAGIAFTDTIPNRPFAQPIDFMGLPLLGLFESVTLDYRDGRIKFDYKK